MTWKTGDADEFLEDIMKPDRLVKLEEYWYDDMRTVLFEESDANYWMVQIKGIFQDFELAEIARALRAVNKAGKL